MIEVLNPFAAPDDVQVQELEWFPNVSHEGIGFSLDNPNIIYFVDEWNSGSIYQYVSAVPGQYGRGQTSVLKIVDFNGDPAANWDEGENATEPRVGKAVWVPLTYTWGTPRPGITNPFRNGPTNDPRTNDDTMGGRPAADDAGGTPYGRPEDLEVGRLANGREVVYFAATSEQAVYTIEVVDRYNAIVRVLVSADTPRNVGFPATTGVLNSPDNLAQDALGNIYIIEDAPNSSDIGGDVWYARDVDNDGVAESLDHFLSIQVDGSESTGMVFSPVNPTEFVMAVQHPDSTDLTQVPNGLGDAVWKFEIGAINNQGFVKELRAAHARKTQQ